MEVTSFSRGPRHLVLVIFAALVFLELTESCHRKVEYHYKLKRPPPHHSHHHKPHGHGYHRGPPGHGGGPHHGGGHGGLGGGYHNIHKGYVPVRGHGHHHQGGGGHPGYHGGGPLHGKGHPPIPTYGHGDEHGHHGPGGHAEVHGAGYKGPIGHEHYEGLALVGGHGGHRPPHVHESHGYEHGGHEGYKGPIGPEHYRGLKLVSHHGGHRPTHEGHGHGHEHGGPPSHGEDYEGPPREAGHYGGPPREAGHYGGPPAEAGHYGGPPGEAGHYGGPPGEAAHYGRPKGHDTHGYKGKGYKYQMIQTHQYDDKDHYQKPVHHDEYKPNELDESTPVYLQKGYGVSGPYKNVEYTSPLLLQSMRSPTVDHINGQRPNSFNMFDEEVRGQLGQQMLQTQLDAADTADLIRKGKDRHPKQKENPTNPSAPLEHDTSGYYAELERLAELYAGSHIPSTYSTEPRLPSSEKTPSRPSFKSRFQEQSLSGPPVKNFQDEPPLNRPSFNDFNNRFRDDESPSGPSLNNRYQDRPSQSGRLTDPRFPDAELPDGPPVDMDFQDGPPPNEHSMDSHYHGSQLPSMSNDNNNNQSPNMIATAVVNLPANGNTPLVHDEADTGASNLPSHSQDGTSLSGGNFDLNLNYNSELPAAFRRNSNDNNSKKKRRRRRKKINGKWVRPRNPQISHHRDFSNNNLEPQASTTQHHQQIYKGGSDYLEDDFMGDFVGSTGRTQDFTEFMNF